ncbi:hypothetical protein [Clostridium sp.]|uniref:hypothetical protein n=1 Tax=Clostridium sp. TaxID=1506 RepID=UPI001D9AA760|nr:hypothetical protein [Clostridium sp.]MBS5305763.1 hypothetical protein [Clostridium sp.]
MKFYEFKGFEYYALIGAECKEDALKYYQETVADICEEDGEPVEVTKEEAFGTTIECLKGEVGKDEVIKDLEENISFKKPFLLLIDTDLL